MFCHSISGFCVWLALPDVAVQYTVNYQFHTGCVMFHLGWEGGWGRVNSNFFIACIFSSSYRSLILGRETNKVKYLVIWPLNGWNDIFLGHAMIGLLGIP